MSPMLPHFSDIVWPDASSYWIGNARVPLSLLAKPHAFAPLDREDGAALLDVLIENGKVARLAPAGAVAEHARPSICAAASSGRCWSTCTPISTAVTPSCARPMSVGTFKDALAATQADRLRWTHEDLLARMDFGLRCAYGAWRLGDPHPSRLGAGAGRAKLARLPRHARGVAGADRAAGGFADPDRFLPRRIRRQARGAGRAIRRHSRRGDARRQRRRPRRAARRSRCNCSTACSRLPHA